MRQDFATHQFWYRDICSQLYLLFLSIADMLSGLYEIADTSLVIICQIS